MKALANRVKAGRRDLGMALVVTQRELRDSARDWRILLPILLLTFGFPILLNVAVQRMIAFFAIYDDSMVSDRLIPWLLMLAGFFPVTFCLVLALETFVGEKERGSLEPLLATPLTNRQLYLAKMLSSLALPLPASYMAILLYAANVVLRTQWQISWQVLAQILLLTTVQAVIMVAAAVILSSQTTTVRGANLLASFIILPMAMLIQGEAALIFMNNHAGLVWIILALILIAIILMRTGIRLFDRETLLGQDIDTPRERWALGLFWSRFTGRDRNGRYPGMRRWLRGSVSLLRELRLPAVMLLVALLGGVLVGALLAERYPLSGVVHFGLAGEGRTEDLLRLQALAAQLPLTIFLHNLRALMIAAVLGLFSFGALGVIVFMLPWSLLSFLAAQFAQGGGDAGAYLLTTVAPHGVVELPALLLAAAAALRWHTVLMAPPAGRLSEGWLLAAADYARILVVFAVPLLFVASLLEAYLTPLVLLYAFG